MASQKDFKDAAWAGKKVVLVANHSEFSVANPEHPINILAQRGAEVWVIVRRTASTRGMFENHPNVSGVVVIEGVGGTFATIRKLRSIKFDEAFFYTTNMHFERYTPHLACFFTVSAKRRSLIIEKEGISVQVSIGVIFPSLLRAFYPYGLMAGDILLTSIVKRKSRVVLKSARIKKIVLIRLDHIGDMIISSSLIDALRTTYPNAEIHLVLNPTVAALFLHDPRITRVYSFKAPWYMRSPSKDETRKSWKELTNVLIPTLRKNKYSLAIDCQGDLFDSWIAYKSGASFVSGLISPYHNKGIISNSSFLTHPVVLPEEKIPEAELKEMLAKSLGYTDTAALMPHIIWNDEDYDFAREIISSVPDTFHTLAVHLSSSKKITQWPIERYQEVMEALAKKYKNKIAFFLLGASSEFDLNQNIVNALIQQGIYAKNLAGVCTLLECAALFSQVDLFLGNDSGPMHLAAASGTRVVALYIPVFASLYAPRGPQHRFIIAGENDSIDSIPTDIVIRTVEEELERKAS